MRTDLNRWERERGYPMLRERVLAHYRPDWRKAAEQKELLLLPIQKPRLSL